MAKKSECSCVDELNLEEQRFYRDKLRDARYAALADAEGFSQLCFAFELLGSRLCGAKLGLGKYKDRLKCLAADVWPANQFDALFRRVLDARNDAMHTGAYARNAAQAAVQLSLMLEEVLMSKSAKTVADYMVNTPVYLEEWHTLGYARQLMLVNSFSYLPIFLKDEDEGEGKWHLISDMAMAQFFQGLSNGDERKKFEAKPLKCALVRGDQSLNLIAVDAPKVRTTEISELLKDKTSPHPGLWLVVNATEGGGLKQLIGVLSPFELM